MPVQITAAVELPIFHNKTRAEKMNQTTQQEDDEEKAKARLLSSFDYLLNHNGSGHLEVNTKILKRGQKDYNSMQPPNCWILIRIKHFSLTDVIFRSWWKKLRKQSKARSLLKKSFSLTVTDKIYLFG